MRDIVQTSITIYNPFSGAIAAGSKIESITPDYTSDGFLDENGYIFEDGIIFDNAEIWQGY